MSLPHLTGIVHQPRGGTILEYLSLEDVRVRAWVVDVSSRIVLAQTFYNSSDEPTGRAKYVFPLPASAAVCAFELEMPDGTVVVGEVKEKEEAALMFTNAIKQGETAALTERVGDDIFTISVGSIPAKSKVIAHLTFVMDLLDEGLQDRVRLQLPMHIAERYGTPPAAMQNASAADSRTCVDVWVDIQTSDVIHEIHSPTHSIVRQRYKTRSGRKSQRRMSASWKSSLFLTQDFVIVIHAEGLDKPRCFAEVLDAKGNGSSEGTTIAMQLTLVPKFQAPRVLSQEFIFIIDRSGSMGGASIETAKRTLAMLLRLLPSTQTTFNIFSFGSHVTSLWNSSRQLDPVTLAEASSHVMSMKADYGGTEIPMALQSAFSLRGHDRPANFFLLTDGQSHADPFVVVSDAVLNAPPQAPVRVFVLGIGTGVSSDVCSHLARVGNGECLFALSAEEIQGKCARLLNAGRSKNIERIDIDWGQDASGLHSSSPFLIPKLPVGLPELEPPPSVQQAPHSLTRFFSSIRFTLFAIISSRTVPKSIRLLTKLQGVAEPQELIVEVVKVMPFHDFNSTIPIVHTLAARKLVMDLDDGFGPLPRPAPGDALMTSEDILRKAGMVRLGLTYQLVSKHTSFIAVRKGDEQRRREWRRRSGMAWARSRLQQTDRDTPKDSHTESPTFLDGLIDDLSFLVSSVLGFFSGPVASSATNQRLNLPGAYDESNSGTSELDRGRRRSLASSGQPRRRSASSHHSIDSFSTLSSLDGSSCSACWTESRSSSPLPTLPDPIQRTPSPQFPQLRVGAAPSRVRRRDQVPQEAYKLFFEMAFDGSFTATPLLTQVVGTEVLGKASSLGISDTVWATVVVVAYMQRHFQCEPDILELVSERAKEFVQVSGHDARHFQQMVWEAAKLLNS